MPDGMKKYSELLAVDEKYYPEINPNSIRSAKEDWVNTLPHPSFIELLEKTERMIGRETIGKKHSIWIQGSYGTGKSRVIWTTMELLKCSDEAFIAYFDKYDALKKKTDLRDKLLAHKHKRLVTVYRYKTGDINSTDRLISAIYDSVTGALRTAGYDYLGKNTLRGRIAGWLEDESNQQILQIKMDKPEYRSKGSFAGKTSADILAQLKGRGNADVLLDELLLLSEKEKVGIYNLDIEDLKEWLSDVIDANHLSALVFFWDEFSSYFRRHKDSLDVFQSLVELCNEKPFEMVISTHMADSIANDDQFKTVSDRFEDVKIEMPDHVAFELMRHAIKPIVAAEPLWETYKRDIAERVTEPIDAVVRLIGIEELILRDLTPIHPMAALLLKYIAENFASNQRSMFNFIKSDESDDLHAFQWFIRTHSPDVPDLLTIDRLWDFFYKKGRDEYSPGEGRVNLHAAIASVLDTYPQHENILNEDEQRVLKTVLMMQAISKRTNNGVALLRPIERNIRLAFDGDDTLSRDPIPILKNVLIDRYKILFASPTESGVDEYLAATVQGDQVKIDDLIRQKRTETTTLRLIQAAGLSDAILYTGAEKRRFDFTSVCVENFTNTVNKLTDPDKRRDSHIYVVACFARDDAEQAKLREMIGEARGNPETSGLVFIDACSEPLGSDRFDEWAKHAAHEEYWRAKDDRLADNHMHTWGEVLRGWKDAVGSGHFFVYYGTRFEKEPASAEQLKDDILPRIVLHRFPLAFDNAAVSDNFFHLDNYVDGAKRGIEQRTGGIFTTGSVQSILGQVWNVPEYWMQPRLSALPISRLKRELDEWINAALLSDGRVAHTDIYDYLYGKGFLPCNLYAFLTGFLLKEYAVSPYRYSIGDSDQGDMQEPKKLGEHIGECFKYKDPDTVFRGKYVEKYIAVLSPAQKAFVDFTVQAFGVSENASVESAVSSLRIKLIDLRYPIWCFKEIDESNLEIYLDDIAAIANNRERESVSALTEKFGKRLKQNAGASDALCALLTADNGRKALDAALRVFEDGALYAAAEAIHAPNLLEDARRVLSSGDALWLWDQESGEEELAKLLVEYQIVEASNHFAGNGIFNQNNSYDGCISSWKQAAGNTHLPADTLRERQGALRSFLNLLSELLSEGALRGAEKKSAFLRTLHENRDEIAALLSNRVALFAEYFSQLLAGLDSVAIQRIYGKLPADSFQMEKSDYFSNVEALAEQERAAQQKSQLRLKWRELSGGFDDARTWSQHYQTPILALVPDNEQNEALCLFDVLNRSDPSESQLTAAISYLDRLPAFLSQLREQEAIDRAFSDKLIGDYCVLVEAEEARQAIRDRGFTDPYNWLTGDAARKIIRDLAERKYLSGENRRLLEYIDKKMGDRAAKDCLKRLVKNALEVGIQMMRDGGI